MSERDHLTEARRTAAYSDDAVESPDERSVPYLLAGILDALVAIAERLPALPEPGICGDRQPPLRLSLVDLPRPHCVLKAGHAGMHSDGEGYWTPAPTHRPDRDQTESEAE